MDFVYLLVSCEYVESNSLDKLIHIINIHAGKVALDQVRKTS